MKNVEGFSKTGNWYKGNLHCHSTNSDGKLSPKEVVDLFKENGYSFLCFSDHDIYTDYRSEFDSEDFIILPGLEASVNLFDESGKYRMKVHGIHLGFWVLPKWKKRQRKSLPIWKEDRSRTILEIGTAKKLLRNCATKCGAMV